MENMDVLHQDTGMYTIYNEYLRTVQDYALNKIKSLPIRYYKINIARTKGIDTEIKLINNKRYNIAYDIFDLTQVIDTQPLTYSNEQDETNQGIIRKTYGTMTIFGINQPLPGDIFHYYASGVDPEADKGVNQSVQETIEYFTVNNVTFIKNAQNLNIYMIEFSTANIGKNIADNLNIINHFYYLKEFKKFFDSEIYEDYIKLINNRNSYMIEIDKLYNSTKCQYILDFDNIKKLPIDDTIKLKLTDLGKLINLKINQAIYTLADKHSLNFAPVLFRKEVPFIKDILRDIILKDTTSFEMLRSVCDKCITQVNNIADLEYIYNRLENYKMDQFKEIGTDLEHANRYVNTDEKTNTTSVVRDLKGNVING